jgi:hypothetical protein
MAAPRVSVGDYARDVLANPGALIAEGFALLDQEARDNELERRALVPDEQLSVLQAIRAELVMINARLGALEVATYTPKVRVPVRDDMGRIIEVVEKIAEPEYH